MLVRVGRRAPGTLPTRALGAAYTNPMGWLGIQGEKMRGLVTTRWKQLKQEGTRHGSPCLQNKAEDSIVGTFPFSTYSYLDVHCLLSRSMTLVSLLSFTLCPGRT